MTDLTQTFATTTAQCLCQSQYHCQRNSQAKIKPKTKAKAKAKAHANAKVNSIVPEVGHTFDELFGVEALLPHFPRLLDSHLI